MRWRKRRLELKDSVEKYATFFSCLIFNSWLNSQFQVGGNEEEKKQSNEEEKKKARAERFGTQKVSSLLLFFLCGSKHCYSSLQSLWMRSK